MRAALSASRLRSNVAARRKESCGFRLDAAHVLVDARVVVVPDALLPNLAGANVHHGASQDGDDFR